MVFESIVVDLLNRILGSYFENLDTSQLKLGIWGGDAVLRDLVLKTSAMDDLGLPFKVVIGKLGNLTMRIPWQSLYTAPVELDLKNLYLLVVPSYAVAYNEEHEEIAIQARKQAELARIDELRKHEQLKKAGTTEAPPPDTFSEKLITQIIKNVQIKIESIHIRYEDSVTLPKTPFAFGTILKHLNVQTTDENGKLAIITETVNVIHKLAKLEGLSVYWNSNTTMISQLTDKTQMLNGLQECVTKDVLLTHVLGPISSEGKVKLTPSPEKLKFAQSKFIVDVDMKELAIGLTNRQFQDAMSLAEALDFMSRAQYYRKYRPPFTEHKGHYKDWWKFAYRCIVEEDVRRRQLNWNWQHIKHHRQLVKVYAEVYYQKLTNKKPKPEIDAKILQCEKALDVFNITLVRKQVEVRVDRQVKKEPEKPSGWFSGWFGGGAAATEASTSATAEIAKKFEEALTQEEKAKLYDAIDYTEGAAPVDYPQTYLAYVLQFHLHKLRCIIRDVTGNTGTGENILDLQIANVEHRIATRPYKNGLKLDLSMGSIEAIGVQRSEHTPPFLISSQSTGVGGQLVSISFEMNPLTSTASQKIVVQLAPVEIVYHSKTIIELVRCFTLPQEMQLSKLQAATVATINQWREQSAAGLQYLIDTRGEIDINIHFLAPYFLIPQGGALSQKGSVLVFDLGEISVKSKPRVRERIDKSEQAKKTKEEIRQEVIDKSYDSFLVTLNDFQVLLALPGDNFRAAIQKTGGTGSKGVTGMELIKSQQFIVQLDQCLVQDDPQLPKFKISATLPLLDLVITENRFMELLKLVVTLPFPQSAPATRTSLDLSHDAGLAESVAVTRIAYTEMERKDSDSFAQFTELVAIFTVSAIRFRINRVHSVTKSITPLAEFEMKNLKSKITQKTFSLGFDVSVGGLALIASSHSAPGIRLGELYLLRTPMNQEHLLKLTFFSISSDCPPKYATDVKQWIKCDVSTLDLILHQEALHTLMAFTYQILESFQTALEVSDSASMVAIQATSVYVTKKEDKKQISRFEATRKAVAKKHQDSKDILLQCNAHLHRLTVQLSTERKNILRLVLGKLDVSFEQKPKTSSVSMELTEFDLLNLDPAGFYTKIISQELDKVIYVKLKMYEGLTAGPGYHDVTKYDMKLKVETGSPRIVYLNPFLEEVMGFVDKFQAAKDAVMEASSAAAEMAKEGVEQAYSTGTRALIDIEFKSPQIIIPRNAQSSTGFIAYLGNLSVKNSFKEMNVEGGGGSRVIIDDIQTILQEMKMSRIMMDRESQRPSAECSILDPVTLRLNIERNLGVGAYPEIPAIQIKGEMASTSIRCSNEDYVVLLASLTENISNKGTPDTSSKTELPPSSVKVDVKTKALVSRQASRIRAESETSKTGEVTTLIPAKKDDKVYCNFKLELVMGQTSVVLYEGSSHLEGQEGVVERNEKMTFAKFTIANIDQGVLMYTNGNMICNTGIGNISLEDIRPGERQITNLIHRRIPNASRVDSTLSESLITVSFRTEPALKLGSTLIVEITGMTFVLCLEYLFRLVGFFTSSDPAQVTPDQDGIGYQEFNIAGEPGPVREITPPKVVADGGGKEGEEPFRMFLTMGETDLILVETVERLDTNGLLLNCEASVKHTSVGGKTNLMSALNNIRLSTCKYDPGNRGNSLAEVISPMSITLVMNTGPEGMQIDVNISDIFIRLTAGTVELLMTILSTSFQRKSDENGGDAGIDWTNVWNMKSNRESKFWFLNPRVNVEVGMDALTAPEVAGRLFDQVDEIVKKDKLLLESGCIVMTFETGSGTNTTPILLIESDLDFQMFDWSQKLQMSGRMKLEAAYYNAVYGMWEFLVEPVETRHHGKVSHRPWELFVEYYTLESLHTKTKGADDDESLAVDLAENQDQDKPKSYMSVSLISNDILELTVTRAALDITYMLMADFNEGVKSLVSQKEVMTSPYAVTNDLGVDIKLDFRGSPFTLVRKGQVYEEALLKPGTSLNLTLAETYDMTTRHTSILKEQEGREERLLRISVEELEFMADIPVNRADKRYYPLKKTSHGLPYALLCDTQVNGTSKVITIRSVVEIVNHLKVPVDIFYMSEDGNSVLTAGSAGGGQTFNVPINCLYTRSSELYFAPKGYNLSSLACVWTTLLKDTEGFSQGLQCRIKAGEGAEFHLKVIGKVAETLFEGTNRISAVSRCCSIHLKAPLNINNLLPVGLEFGLTEGATSVRGAEQGHYIQVTDMAVDKNKDFSVFLKIPSYENQSWKSLIEINKSTPELSPWLFTSIETPSNTLYLGIHKDTTDDSLTLHLYSPFWMVNRTGMTLAYHVRDSPTSDNLLMNLCTFCGGEQAEDQKDASPILHPPQQNPILFSFRGKSFFAKKKAVVRVEGESDWSTKFPVDVAGSCGSVTCKSPIKEFEIGIEILLTGWGLTKTVIFSPRYYLINQCSYIVEVTEAEKEGSKMKILPNTCTPFWPRSHTPQLVLRIDNTNEFSKRFSYEKSDEILLQLGNKYGGVHVDVHITEASHLLTFTEFTTGHAAVLIVNHTADSPIEVWDKGVGESRRRVGPGMNELMTWQDPMGEKAISWSPVGLSTSFQDRLNGDGFGTYKAPNEQGEERIYHWLSFLDGLQRVLLFTSDKNLVATLQASRDTESPTAEYFLILHGLGLSLVDTAKCQEILYMRIASSEIVWESQKPGKRQRFKPIPLKKSSIIESAYQNYMNERVVNPNVKGHFTLDAGMEVDFVDLKMFKPYDRTIRRMFQTGLWVHYKTYPHTYLIHAKLNRIQIDNQLPDCIFRIVLAPVPPPKSVSSDDDGQKPFAEVSIMERIIEHSSVVQYKYFKVLIQEFQIKMDIHFVNAIVDLFSEDKEKRLERMVEYFDKDYAEATTDFGTFLDRHVVSQGQKNFYDFLHLSPLKIHLSFSMGGATQVSNTFLNLLIASLGVSVTEVQDVVFKLACMELQHLFLTKQQLMSEAYQHYASQAVRQLYVLVLGLDVIGNPYGLILGFTQGVGAFFYEPFHGAIQGPGEFMEGLALGVKSLFGHTIGGMSGAMSKIAGTFGKGVAALTLDDEYQKKRRENLSKRQTAGEGFVESGKDLVMGFVDGMSGVFMQPVRGAKKDGVEGFFKGLGKGAIGLVTRPAAGIIDFTSGSFDAVKKATSVSDETRRMRPPRYISPKTALQPYVLHEAEGITLFTELDKGKYAATDSYVAHALVNPHGVYVILLTNRRVLYLKKIDIFGGWGVQWTCTWEELDGPPDVVEQGLSFRIKAESVRRNILRCQSKASQVVIPLYSPDVATWLLEKIDEAMRKEMGVAVGEDALQQQQQAEPSPSTGRIPKAEPKPGTSKDVPRR